MLRKLPVLALGACGLGLALWFLADRSAGPARPVSPAPLAREQGAPGEPARVEPPSPAVAREPAPEIAPARAEHASVEPAPALPAGGLLVEVVDADERPAAGVAVELALHIPGFGRDGVATAISRAPDGLAQLDLESLAQLRERLQGHSIAVGFEVQADFAGPGPARVELPGWPADGDRVRLALPPSGGLRVRLLDSAGEALANGRVAWFWLPADVAAADPSAGYERVARHIVELREGVALIGPIGLGTSLSLSASSPGLGSTTLRGIEGPRVASEVRALDVRLGPSLATLRLRALDVAGAPLADATLWAELWSDPARVPSAASGPPRPSSFSARSDAAGRIEFDRDPGQVTVAPRLDLTFQTRNRDPQTDERWSVASILLPTELGEGELVELGDVQLAPVPLLFAGRVTDSAGKPLERVDLHFQVRYGEGPEYRWHNLPDGRIRSDGEGRFRLRGVRLPRALGVTVHGKGFAARTLYDLPIGATDQLIVLEPEAPAPSGGTLRVEVALEHGIPFMQLLLKFRRRGGGGRSPDWYPGAVLEFGALEPGTYDVWVETRKGGFELGRVEGVELRVDEETADPRLLPLDLRGAARLVELLVVRPDGTPWRRTEFFLAPLPSDSDLTLKTDDAGQAACVLPRAATRIRVGRKGEEPLLVDLPAGEEPIRVELLDR